MFFFFRIFLAAFAEKGQNPQSSGELAVEAHLVAEDIVADRFAGDRFGIDAD